MKGRGSGITPGWVKEILANAVSNSNQSEVSKAIGISHSMLHRYLRGIGEPTLAILKKLANYTGQTFTIEIKPD